MDSWMLVLAVCAASVVLRLLPEAVLRGREPPSALRDTFVWLPVAVAGTFVGVQHFGAAPDVRPEFLLAGVAGAATLLWRRTLYVPLAVGVVVLALLRA